MARAQRVRSWAWHCRGCGAVIGTKTPYRSYADDADSIEPVGHGTVVVCCRSCGRRNAAED